MRNKSGFTLMEMMVVIAIIGVVSAIAIPNMVGRFQEYRVGEGARELLGVLQSSRIGAARHNNNVVVTFDPDNNGSLDNNYLSFVDSGGIKDTFDAGEAVIARGQMPAGVTLTSVTFGGNTWVRISNRGLASNSGTVTLTNTAGTTRRVNLFETGNSRIVIP
ncbi:MAG: prepilin-type N-terminal cleavage/methylation domain-containing protein [Desulfobacteraceae bacterium]|nr:prepilin-type N-terminal cleavage/methylation domain-containing protein [Desulfobacteraceae bacterium]